MKGLVVLGIGGNAIRGDSYKEEGRSILRIFKGLELIRDGPLVITYGNGPHVGRILSAQDIPLWLCTAQTQGEIGTLIQQALIRFFERQNISRKVIWLGTSVTVDPKELSLQKASKPIGDFHSEEETEELKRMGYIMEEDPAGRGWRRIVRSPKPLAVVEMEEIKSLLRRNVIVIAGGGGGIPVYQSGDALVPVEAVVDKDFTSSLISSQLKAEKLVLLTDQETVKLNFQGPRRKSLRNLTVDDAKKFLEEGQFLTGMRTKIEAGISFLEKGKGEVLITGVFKLKQGLEGKTGTIIKKGGFE